MYRYIHKYVAHTVIKNKNLPATDPCPLCVSPTVKTDLGTVPQQGQRNTVKHCKKPSHACSELCFGCSVGFGTSCMVLFFFFSPSFSLHALKSNLQAMKR